MHGVGGLNHSEQPPAIKLIAKRLKMRKNTLMRHILVIQTPAQSPSRRVMAGMPAKTAICPISPLSPAACAQPASYRRGITAWRQRNVPIAWGALHGQP